METHHDLRLTVRLLLSYSFFFFLSATPRCGVMMVRLETRRVALKASHLPPVGRIFMYRFLYDTNDWDVDYLRESTGVL